MFFHQIKITHNSICLIADAVYAMDEEIARTQSRVTSAIINSSRKSQKMLLPRASSCPTVPSVPSGTHSVTSLSPWLSTTATTTTTPASVKRGYKSIDLVSPSSHFPPIPKLAKKGKHLQTKLLQPPPDPETQAQMDVTIARGCYAKSLLGLF